MDKLNKTEIGKVMVKLVDAMTVKNDLALTIMYTEELGKLTNEDFAYSFAYDIAEKNKDIDGSLSNFILGGEAHAELQ